MSYYHDLSTTALNLIRAKNLIINPENWLQHLLIDGDRCCASGAVHQCIEPFAVPKEWRDRAFAARSDAPRGAIPEEYWFLRLALRQIDPDGAGYIGAYNDSEGRTHSEIMHLFDTAISLCIADQLAAA
jgi:hypothetical protein